MEVRLQKQLAFKYKEKLQYKHVIVIPEEAINELCWKGGQQLDLCVKDGQLIVQAKNTNQRKT